MTLDEIKQAFILKALGQSFSPKYYVALKAYTDLPMRPFPGEDRLLRAGSPQERAAIRLELIKKYEASLDEVCGDTVNELQAGKAGNGPSISRA